MPGGPSRTVAVNVPSSGVARPNVRGANVLAAARCRLTGCFFFFAGFFFGLAFGFGLAAGFGATKLPAIVLVAGPVHGDRTSRSAASSADCVGWKLASTFSGSADRVPQTARR